MKLYVCRETCWVSLRPSLLFIWTIYTFTFMLIPAWHIVKCSSMQTHQVEILRSDLQAKQAEYTSEKFAHTKVETERQSLITELQNIQKAVTTANKESSTLRSELARMTSLLLLADQVSQPTTIACPFEDWVTRLCLFICFIEMENEWIRLAFWITCLSHKLLSDKLATSRLRSCLMQGTGTLKFEGS